MLYSQSIPVLLVVLTDSSQVDDQSVLGLLSSVGSFSLKVKVVALKTVSTLVDPKRQQMSQFQLHSSMQ